MYQSWKDPFIVACIVSSLKEQINSSPQTTQYSPGNYTFDMDLECFTRSIKGESIADIAKGVDLCPSRVWQRIKRLIVVAMSGHIIGTKAVNRAWPELKKGLRSSELFNTKNGGR